MNELCKCACHTNPGIKHEGACCMTCSRCHGHILFLAYGAHQERCQESAPEEAPVDDRPAV